MSFSKIMLSLSILALAASVAVAGDPEHWVQDFDEALKQAKAEGKDLLVDFTGSDWCGWCIRLNKEVFDTPTFNEAAPKKFVLTMLDFPRADAVKAKVPNPERNQELQAKWGVTGFPTILLVTADGVPYAKTGYREGGPDAYLEHLTEIRKNGLQALQKVNELSAALTAAQGEEKLALLDRAVSELASLDAGSPIAVELAGMAKMAMTADPDNAAGLKLRAVEALMSAGQTDDAVTTAAKQLDPKNEKGLLEKVVLAKMQSVADESGARDFCKAADELAALGTIKDKETGKMVFGYAAMFSARLQDSEGAKKFATLAKPYAEGDERFLQMLDEILKG